MCLSINYRKMFDIFLVLVGLCVMVASAGSAERERSHGDMIGFTAWLSDTQTYTTGDTILFDGGNINEGDGYIPALGKFFCPVSAVYFITVNLKRSFGIVNWVKVVIDETEILDVFDGNDYNDHNIASNSALVQCNQNQSISVVGATSGAVYGEADVQHSTFTVFMMSQGGALGLHNGTGIGFSAYLTGEGDHYYTADDTIRFTGILYNSGAYYPGLGVFVCPVSGYYFISTNLLKNYVDPLHLGISLDDTAMVLHSQHPSLAYSFYYTISNSRFIECSAGQTLVVKGIAVGNVQGSDSHKWTTLSVMYIGEKTDTRKHAGFIGFTAFKGSHQSYGPGDVVTFDKILVNEGGDFNGSTFICPTTAIYFMTVNFKKAYEYPIYLDVVQGSTTIFRSEESYFRSELNTVSNSGLFLYLQGEKVQVQGYQSGWLHGDPVKIFSTFSIMMMSPM